ncbi:DUF72 domain-containing protein [Chroogloeocystis siderophila]|uniref:DUF72 domain-containing protein n=1 Tax=Chroogloeocystis siderophila 5.2 s.c.1 TaxID=247279 RepID=A0A1U7HEE3_9CHRO|nr:DUF72 domain-containing protein [Chroogloeocystis siderophila]OKH21939.1 hypothetical protein NIES1031_20930 [Chroogloeocystis siderophila 5.2 s.c.1]
MLRIGCAVWSYKGWVGDFYPAGSRASEFLRLYSRRLTTVEGNTTFYATPDQETVARWAADTPSGFEFCLKLPRELTHQGLLKPSISGALSFLEQMRGLGSRLGPIFAQLPPRYGPECLEDLTAFLSAWSQENAELALEVRHPGWFTEPYASQLTSLLEELGIGRVLLDSRPIYDTPEDVEILSERRKPKLPLPLSVTAPFSLIRFISHPQQKLNQSFLQEWVSVVDAWLRQGKRVYFFVHCPQEARSPGNVRYFQQMLEQHGVAVPPLPWDSVGESPTQLNLF